MTNSSLSTEQSKSDSTIGTGRVSARQWAMLGIILIVAGFVRFYHIAGPSLWMDEIWSIEISTGRGSPHDHLPVGVIQTEQLEMTGLAGAPPWWHVWTHMSGVTHPPLYHVVLRWWMVLFGNSATATRSLSAVFSILAIVVLFDVSRLQHGTAAALVAAALMAVAGAQLETAQDTRSYTMLILLGLCCADLVVRVERFGATTGRLVWLVVFLAAMALTHYFAAWGILVLGIYALVRSRGRDRIRTIGAFAVGGLVAGLLWGSWFIEQLRSLPSFSPDFLVESGTGHFEATLRRVIELPAVFLFGQAAATKIWPSALALTSAVVVLVPAIQLSRRRELLFWVLWIVAIVGGIGLVDLLHGSAYAKFVRYSMLASPAVYVLLAAGAAGPARSFLRRPVALVFLILVAWIATERVADGVPPKEDWRRYAALLDSNAGSDDLLVFYNDSPWITPGMWYMNFKYYAPESHRPWLILDHPADAALLATLRHQRALWLIGNYPARDAGTVLPGWQPAAPELREETVGGMCLLSRPGN